MRPRRNPPRRIACVLGIPAGSSVIVVVVMPAMMAVVLLAVFVFWLFLFWFLVFMLFVTIMVVALSVGIIIAFGLDASISMDGIACRDNHKSCKKQ